MAHVARNPDCPQSVALVCSRGLPWPFFKERRVKGNMTTGSYNTRMTQRPPPPYHPAYHLGNDRLCLTSPSGSHGVGLGDAIWARLDLAAAEFHPTPQPPQRVGAAGAARAERAVHSRCSPHREAGVARRQGPSRVHQFSPGQARGERGAAVRQHTLGTELALGDVDGVRGRPTGIARCIAKGSLFALGLGGRIDAS